MMTISSFGLLAGGGEISGRILDDKGEPVPYASVSLEKNGSEINGSMSDKNGYYSITGISAGEYLLKTSVLNYAPYSALVSVSEHKITYVDITLTFSAHILPIISILPSPIDEGDVAPGPKFPKVMIDKMPVTNDRDIIAYSPGSYQPDDGDEVQFMGHRTGTSAKYVDGILVPGNLSIPMPAIEEIKILLTGIPSRYGDVTAGVILVTTSSY